MSATDIETRVADEGRVPLVPLIHAHDVRAGGLVMQDANVKVACAVVDHPMIRNALAYRFEAPDRSIVISGDTAKSDTLKRHLLASPPSAEDCGRVAAAAGVGTLVLSHFVPPDDPSITEAMWADRARLHFSGRIVVGHDLMEI